MESLKLCATATTSANALAQVVIPNKTRIRGIQWAVRVDSVTDNTHLDLEVSRASANQISVNGAQQSMSVVSLDGNFVTSGLSLYGINQFFPLDVPVIQGQIIYLHVIASGTLSATIEAILWFT